MREESFFGESFGSLPVLRIWINNRNERSSFPIPAGLGGIDNVIMILGEICRNYYEDFGQCEHLFQDFPPSDPEEFFRYHKRAVWRIGSFIVFALNLELTLEQRYEDLLDFARKLQPNFVAPSDMLVSRRKEEIRKYKYYRNKIFAHTAFGSPRPEDNLSMKATSLMYFEARSCGITPEGISIGGMSVTAPGLESPQFSPLTFRGMVSEFGEHLMRWYEMFGGLCAILQSATDDEISQYIEGMVKITRRT
jgi:hypothetical protein